MNPGSMTWQDLGAIWLFELGDQWDAAAIEFGPDAVTTLDLQRQEGVLEEKQKALDAIACGDINKPISDEWPYGWKELAAGVRQGNWGTSFLGSYTTSIDIVANDDGSYTLNYHVTNRSRWTSATRLRWNRQGIIPDQARGEGWHLGGEVRQEWYWSEKVTP